MGIEIIIIAGIAFLLITFLMGRSAQKKQAQRQTELMQEMKAGDWVMTQSGFYGKFVELDGAVVILENEDGVESYWSQAAVAMIKNPPFAQIDEENIEAETSNQNENNPEEPQENIAEQQKLEEKLQNSESSLENEKNR